MRTEDFVKTLRQMTANAPAAPPAVAVPRDVGLGADASEFETVASDATATARKIVAAAALARGGGAPAPKLSSTAEAILLAGRRRRAEV